MWCCLVFHCLFCSLLFIAQHFFIIRGSKLTILSVKTAARSRLWPWKQLQKANYNLYGYEHLLASHISSNENISIQRAIQLDILVYNEPSNEHLYIQQIEKIIHCGPPEKQAWAFFKSPILDLFLFYSFYYYSPCRDEKSFWDFANNERASVHMHMRMRRSQWFVKNRSNFCPLNWFSWSQIKRFQQDSLQLPLCALCMRQICCCAHWASAKAAFAQSKYAPQCSGKCQGVCSSVTYVYSKDAHQLLLCIRVLRIKCFRAF